MNPRDLSVSGLRAVLAAFKPQATHEQADALAKAAEQNRDDLLRFLENDRLGQEAWQNAVTNAIDVKPLPDELATIFQARQNNQESVSVKRFDKAQLQRLVLGVVFICVGFLVIFTTYWLIPTITEKMLSAKLSSQLVVFEETTSKVTKFQNDFKIRGLIALNHDVRRSLKELADKQAVVDSELKSASSAIESSFKTVRDTSTSLSSLISGISPAELTNRLNDISEAKAFGDRAVFIKQQLNEIEKPVGTPPVPPTDAEKLTRVKALLDDIRIAVTLRERSVDLKSFSDLAIKVGKLSDAASNLKLDVKRMEDAIETPKPAALAPPESAPPAVALPAPPTILAVLGKLTAAIESIDGNVSEISSKLVSDDENKSQSELLADALQEIEKTGKSAQEAAEVMQQMAYRGTAPAVLILFAIGGMFVVFGVTSLAAWARGAEWQRDVAEWDSRAQLFSSVWGTMLARGAKPSELVAAITTMQAGLATSPSNEVGTPISATLAELIKAIREGK